jgi:hypothetical protein
MRGRSKEDERVDKERYEDGEMKTRGRSKEDVRVDKER